MNTRTAEETVQPTTALPRLYRPLLKIEKVLFIYTLIASIIACVLGALQFGIGIRITGNVANTGSMRPTIDQGSLLVEDSRIPFEDLQVGDIIEFKDRADNIATARSSVSMSFTPVYVDKDGNEYDNADGKGTIAFKGSASEPTSSHSEPDPMDADYKDEGIRYKDVDYTIVHRIIGIREADENSDRALFTEGDNNDGKQDLKTVMKSGYVSTVTHYYDYFGWPLYWLDHGGFMIPFFAMIIIGLTLGLMYAFSPVVKEDVRMRLGVE